MRSLLSLCAALLVVGMLAAPAFALDDVIMKDGTIHKAQILSVEEDGINVKFSPKSGGMVQMKLKWDRLDTYFFYNLRNEKAGDDAKEHLKLALWCVEAGLFSRAKVQVEKATELDPQLVKDIQAGGKLPEIREGIATRVLESAEADIEDGDFENAEKKLEALLARMPDTEAGTQAAQVYKDMQADYAAAQAKAEEERVAQMEEEQQKLEEALQKRVGPIQKDLDKGKEYLSEGLTEDSESKALSLLQKAVGKGEEGIKKIDKLLKDFPDDADLATKADEVKGRVTAGMVKAYLSRADIYTWRGSLNNARKEIEKARKLDPENPDIFAAEQRIDDRNDQDALELSWQRNRREGMRFRGGGAFQGARGGGARGGGGGGRRR